MLFRVRRSVVILTLPLWALHCGDSDGGGSGNAPAASAVSLAEYEQRYVAALCGGFDACCQKGGGALGDAASCPSEAAASLTQQREASEKAGLTFDGAVAGQCLAVLEAAVAACRAPKDADLEEACSLVFHGTKAQAEACNRSDCGRTAGGQLLRCARAAAASGAPGFCQPVSAKEAEQGLVGRVNDICRSTCSVDEDGSSCSTTDGDNLPAGVRTCYTNDGLYCDGERCVARLAAAAPCVSDEACGAGLQCSALQVCTPGTPGCGEPGSCVPTPVVGDACEPDGAGCADGAYCDGASKLCVARKAVGEACNPSGNECATFRCDTGVCTDPDDLTQSSACTK